LQIIENEHETRNRLFPRARFAPPRPGARVSGWQPVQDRLPMIIALLFLILFAILFPKALRFLFALLFLGGIIAMTSSCSGSGWLS
jgi:hypothetical protein